MYGPFIRFPMLVGIGRRDMLAPSGLSWRQTASSCELRQSRAGIRTSRCIMKLQVLLLLFCVNVLCVSAKVRGGPHGRFSNYRGSHHHVNAHHAHFSYHPPSHISFTCRYCPAATSYPVYHGLLPTYVYKYKESGSRFGDLLTGLALYNLGRSAGEQWHYKHYYLPRKEENCSLQVIDQTQFDETSFPCFMMSTFMDRVASMKHLESDSQTIDVATSYIDVKPFLQNNGTPIKITREQECVLWHNLTFSKERNHVPCALLYEYSKTMKPSGVPVYIWLPALVGSVIAVTLCCKCCNMCKKEKVVKEEQPLNQAKVLGYCSNY
ncbi:uncharacterized protein LOC119189567 [Manduca sexta]|uniref:uncharacterized protein LOC119189567 n=1 Tax=Manduca sexta TaxID=7130 RepID=UPI00188F45CC|nr:uncharacterized protein LOC119189567 [Manduca sexta]